VPQNKPTIKEHLGEDVFELPVGIKIDGVFHKTFTLTEMTGAVEEKLMDKKVRTNGGKVMTEAVFGVLETLGNLKKVNKNTVQQMFTVDRDYILLMSYKNSIDDVIEMTETCPHCGTKNDITINVDDIEVNYLAEDEERILEFELPKGVKDGEGKYHKKMKLSFPTGMVQETIFKQVQENPVAGISSMLSFICEDIEGMEHWNPDTFRNLTVRDRKFIQKKVNEIQLGPDLSPKVDCSSCGEEFFAVISATTLLGE
jgi:T4 bacteriophage base plate protein